MPVNKRTGRRLPKYDILAADPIKRAAESRVLWSEKVSARTYGDMAKEHVSDILGDIEGQLTAFLEKEIEIVTTPDGRHVEALKSGSRGQFVSDMKERYGGTTDEGAGEITDTLSTTRLQLIQETNARTAWGYGQWTEGNDQDILDAFPASRFIRIGFVQVPREIHEEHLGEVHLKSNVEFWLSMNAKEDGGFEVPYEPFGFNSQCGMEDVTREEALAELPPEEAAELLAQGAKNPAEVWTPTPQD